MDQKDLYVAAVCWEISLMYEQQTLEKQADTPNGLDTIYMGGGTPSVFEPEQISVILRQLHDTFGIKESAEITLEVNPGTVDLKAFQGYREIGINRISIGVQSFSPQLLSSIGRIHTSEEAVDAIHSARAAGFTNISCDLMTGLSGQSLKDVEDSLSILLANQVPHVSFYALTLEEGTPFFNKYEKNDELLPPPDLERDMYHMMLRQLKKSGYIHYEISNCAKPGFESRHNMTYWRAQSYYGFGCGAFAYINGKRTGNTPDLTAYIKAMTGHAARISSIITESEEINEAESQKEFMMLGFRTMEGVSASEFMQRYGCSMEDIFGHNLNTLLEKGLILYENDRYFLSGRGLDYANEVFREFV